MWMTAVAAVDHETYLGAEHSYNFLLARRHAEAVTDEERGRLDVVGEYHLGEFVNRILPGSLVMQPAEALEGMVAPRYPLRLHRVS